VIAWEERNAAPNELSLATTDCTTNVLRQDILCTSRRP